MLPHDLQTLSTTVRALSPLGDAALAALAAICGRRTFARDAWLLQVGERATLAHVIVEGLVRELYLGDEGEEHTRVFLGEGQLTGSLLDLLSGGPAVTWIQALEPTVTLA